MTETKSVRPLLADADGALRSVLEAAADHEPSAAELAGLRTRLGALLPPVPGGGTGGAGGGGAGGADTAGRSATPNDAPNGSVPNAGASTAPKPGAGPISSAAKIAAILALGGALTAAVVYGRPSTSSGPASTPGTRETPAFTAPSPPPSAEVGGTGEGVDRAASPAAPSSPPSTESASNAAPSTSAVPTHVAAPPSTLPSMPAKDAPSEGTLLTQAHEALLRGDPAKALATTAEHARIHPRGQLVQEREAIAIEALIRAGRSDEARRRASAFHQRWPTSSHRDRIDRLLGDDADAPSRAR